MLFKEKRVQREQMLQAQVEFQCKAGNTCAANLTITDAIHVAGFLHKITSRITRIMRVGKRMRDQRVLLETRPNNSASPTAGDRSHLTTLRDPRDPDHSFPTVLVQKEVMMGAKARMQENKVD